MGWLYVSFLLVSVWFVLRVIKISAPRRGVTAHSATVLSARDPVKTEVITREAPLRWAGAEDQIRFTDLTITCPMAYVTDWRITHRCEEPAAIDFALQVAP